jgi:EAL domain-containing protein (putative c-di-GMP-specific phosphodiesterase class I)
MTRSVALAHLVRQDDGTAEGIWAGHTLRSAFQPIFAFHGDKLEIVAYEGLLRAFRDGEPIAPMTFFNSIPTLDRLHVETLTRTLHLLNASLCLEESASVFVNFNPSVFTERVLADIALRDMRLVLHEAGIEPHRVVCEITEQRSASGAALYGLIETLRAGGFRIAVDDYGAADSDIARVTELQPDIVKFDAHWLSKLMESGPGYALLKTMVHTFEDRGIRTVFEGIEETWQIELAAEAGVSMLQGYALARPEVVTAPRPSLEPDFRFAQKTPAADAFVLPPAARPTPKPERTFGRRVVPT